MNPFLSLKMCFITTAKRQRHSSLINFSKKTELRTVKFYTLQHARDLMGGELNAELQGKGVGTEWSGESLIVMKINLVYFRFVTLALLTA